MASTDSGDQFEPLAESPTSNRPMTEPLTESHSLRPGAAPLYLMVENVRKEHNMGAILRSACAFGVKAVLLCGTHGVKSFASANGAGRVPLLPFPDGVEPAAAWLKKTYGAVVCGVEITHASKSVFSSPWRGATALLLGCERSGLSKRALACCDHVVHIPQFGTRVASLNVAAAAAVVMSWYAAWASQTYEDGLGIAQAEQVDDVDGGQGRFVVEEEQESPDGDSLERQQQEAYQSALRAERAALRQDVADDEGGCEAYGGLFDSNA